MEIRSCLISVVCPTWNSTSFISRTLQSVITQTQLPFELVISDDGSTDDTVEVVERLTQSVDNLLVHIVRNPHKGPGAARNAGIRAAKGDWIAFLDSDDIWERNKVAEVTRLIAERPDFNFFCHNEYHHRFNGSIELLDLASRYRPGISLAKQLFHTPFIATSAVVCRRDVLLSHGGFDETMPSVQDYECWLRMSPSLNIHFIPLVLGHYVDRKGNITSGGQWNHFVNTARALSRNRRHVGWSWYGYTFMRHAAIHFKNQLKTIL